MPIPITAEDVIQAKTEKINELQHDLIMAQLTIRKLMEKISAYEQADAERNAASLAEAQGGRSPAVSRSLGGKDRQTPDQTA